MGLKADIMIQEYIKEAGGADIRCFVIGDKVIAAMKRQAQPGEFRSNLHRGGTASLIRLTPTERKTAVAAAKIMGLRVAGVDLLRSERGPLVMEVNSSPGLEGIETATGKDVAGMIIEYIEKNANPQGTRTRGKAKPNTPFEIGDLEILPGNHASLELEVARLYTQSPLSVTAEIFHGKQAGPVLLVNAAIHGDELNGVEVVRQIIGRIRLSQLRGTLIAIPVVNVFGFIHKSRYLPDRRDLNRSFPGSERGSIAGRMAYRYFKDVVERCTHVVDLHTGAINRTNLPQIRANLTNPDAAAMAEAFGAPVLIDAALRMDRSAPRLKRPGFR